MHIFAAWRRGISGTTDILKIYVSVPIQNLTEKQKVWYAQYVISAILADDEIDASETEFLKQVLSTIGKVEEKKKLIVSIATKTPPSLSAPEGILPEVLAAIFIELVLILISDLDFATKERDFLQKVSHLFNFADYYFTTVMKWGEEGLVWKNSRKRLFEKNTKNFQVPIHCFNNDQKNWYARVLIASIACDGVLDRGEIAFIKMATDFVEDQKEKQRLLAFLRNRMSPPIGEVPDIPLDILGQIFVESMLIISANESINYKEQVFLSRLAAICGFSEEKFNHLLQWCHRGINWKREKNNLIARRAFKAKTTAVGTEREKNRKRKAVVEQMVQCFVCDSEDIFTAFRLYPKTQKTNRNIFGIVAYLENNTGYDYIDYNHVRIIVCPNCFFAGDQIEIFRRSAKDTMPDLLSEAFCRDWLSQAHKRREIVGEQIKELHTLTRSFSTVVKSYQLAISAAVALAESGNDLNQKWNAVSLRLHFAEVLSAEGEQSRAEQILKQTAKKAQKLYTDIPDYSMVFKAARLLILIGLYFGDIRAATPYMDFLHTIEREKIDSLGPADLILFKKIYGEMKSAMHNRSDFKKKNLFGFHMDV